MKSKFYNFFNDWTLFQKLWLLTTILIVLFVSFLSGDSWLGLISSISGVFAVVLMAKGKILAFPLSIFWCGSYAFLAYNYGLYVEAALNAFFFLPAAFISWFLWSRHKKSKEKSISGEDIYANRLTKNQWIILIISFTLTAFLYLFIIKITEFQIVQIGSVAVVVTIFSEILEMLRFAEQWILKILGDTLNIVLWIIALLSSGGGAWGTVIMWCAILINSIFGLKNWLKFSSKKTTLEKVI